MRFDHGVLMVFPAGADGAGSADMTAAKLLRQMALGRVHHEASAPASRLWKEGVPAGIILRMRWHSRRSSAMYRMPVSYGITARRGQPETEVLAAWKGGSGNAFAAALKRRRTNLIPLLPYPPELISTA